MRCVVGIDLGSTTTKAVVLGEDGEVLGRGITNSRSDYDVACDVARSEAFTDVRFVLCQRQLAASGLGEEDQKELISALERASRRSLHVAQLAALRAQMEEEVAAVQQFYPDAKLGPVVDAIVTQMEGEVEAMFGPRAVRSSDFFRDAASSQYHRFARSRACPERLPFEALSAVFDKAILKVEGQQFELSFEQGPGAVIDVELARLQVNPGERTALRRSLAEAFSVELDETFTVGTGYGRARLPFPRQQIRSEILCHGLGAHRMFPDTRTVLDIGGQDTKAIQVDASGIVTSFQMNDRCAAGCGRYLGYIADEMNLGLHELGPLAQQARAPVKINSTCTVFAGAEIRDRLTLGQKREDILAGLHRAVMLRAMSLLARSGGVDEQFTFTGGVARNVTAVEVLRELVERSYGARTLNVSPASIYTGALGAALFASRAASQGVTTEDCAA